MPAKSSPRLPEFLRPYSAAAELLVRVGAVHEVEFSGPTYQIHVMDPVGNVDVWTFLQLDEHGRIIDRFCSCEESLEGAACAHLAASYQRIYNKHAIPLHERFEGSLWNSLCHLYAEKAGYDSDCLQQTSDGSFTYRSVSGKQLFSVKASSASKKAELQESVQQRRRETEETSLKFSNLSEEEIALWKQGRPSSRLLYELSFWGDLAKQLFLAQDRGEAYTVHFEYGEEGLPTRLLATFPDLEVQFYLSEANLVSLIPQLATVHSPLAVKGLDRASIKRITYDPENAILHIERKDAHAVGETKTEGRGAALQQPIEIGKWLYMPGRGFFARDDDRLLAASRLSGDDIKELLNLYLAVVQEHLQGCSVHLEPMVLSYHMHFEPDWRLHVEAYLFEPGDLAQPRSKDFGEWVYVHPKGFYRVTDRFFDELRKIIPSHEVADFVTEQRLWLSQQPGFGPHLAGVEAELAYAVLPDWSVVFSSRSTIEEEPGRYKDFGAWIYLAGQGFFSKIPRLGGSSVLRPGTVVSEQQVPLFIRMASDELQQVAGFFRKESPVRSAGLRVMLTARRTIVITPQYTRSQEAEGKQLHFYGEYVYVVGEGFHELSVACRLPEHLSSEMEVPRRQVVAFLTSELEMLKPRIAELDPRLDAITDIRLSLHGIERVFRSGYEWYYVHLFYHSDKGSIPLGEVAEALAKKERFLFSSIGLIELSHRRFDWLRALNPDRIDRKDNGLTLSVLDLLRLHALEYLQSTQEKTAQAEECRQFFERLMALEEREAPDLTGLGSVLRAYQFTGVRWLWSLYLHQLSGLLCDDMGLGKTHQAMGLMRAIINKKAGEGAQAHILVVCPTSVIFHWQEKMEAYLPGVSVLVYYGIGRSLEDFADKNTILLTSYSLWRRDIEKLRLISFDLAVFDEVQMAKTHTSRLHAALLEVKATMKLGMSGTPIENRLRELKALFDIVLPTYMPADADYREYFLKPIEKESDPVAKALLRRFIHPFVLRRRKEEVLEDLPEKTEEILHCQLSQEQQKLYQEALELVRPTIMQQLVSPEQTVPYLHVFALLSRLKQICNHPAAYLKRVADYRHHHSGKWDLFVELLHEARESGQKVVVFTQYLAMLDIFESYLTDHDVQYAVIRGSTIDRGSEIRRFNRDPKCEVFLSSIQAGGMGIDLTGASVVIHYDRWWNAARENQATDRVHRIGQMRGVQVFKLVTKGTFEERIDQMIKAKGKLMEDVVGIDDQEALKRFDRDELVKLLQDVDTVISGERDE